MAADISKTNGKTSMFYYGETPWHGTGTALENPATAAEAIAAAGMDVEILKQRMVTDAGHRVPRHYATVRQDTGAVLGVVGRRYTILQNRDAFSFFDQVVGEGQAVYHTAGMLGQGEDIWILAKLPGQIVVGKDDVTEKYVVLMNSHTGLSKVKLFPTPIRVVCRNTARMALAGKGTQGIELRHTSNIMDKVEAAKESLGLIEECYAEIEEVSQVLARTQMTEDTVTKALDAIFPSQSTRATNVKTQIRELFESEKNNTMGISGTAWALYNATSEWVDWCRKITGLEKDATRRLSSVWTGSGAEIKARSWDTMKAVAGIEN